MCATSSYLQALEKLASELARVSEESDSRLTWVKGQLELAREETAILQVQWNVNGIQCQCNVNAMSMQCQCNVNAMPMQCQCNVNAMSMQRQCNAMPV